MLLFLSKVIPAFLFPVGLTILFCVAAAWLAFRAKARAAGFASLAAAALLYTAASPIVSNRLLLSLERKVPPPESYAPAAAIVLLGGGMAPILPEHRFPETNASGDRVLHAARLWKAGLAPVVVATGGYITMLTDAPGTEADLYARLLIDLFGLPDSAVVRMGQSRTTYEDAVLTEKLFAERGLKKDILLVTTASHMPRAAALFRKQGFAVHIAPADFRGDSDPAFKLYRLLPSASSLGETTTALHEIIGTWAYRLMGRM
jgi:uncharacterized SAM-binding protein YcdF (DUF218 family)